MSFNLIDLAKSYFTNAAVEKVADFLGEQPNAVQSGISALLPTLVGGMMNKANTTSGVGDLMELINANANPNLLSNFGSTVGNPDALSKIIGGGTGLLSSILGNNTNSIVSSIANFAGLKNNSTSSLLGLAAPLLMNLIGNKVKSDGLGISGLASLLMGQKDYVKAALPAGLSGIANVLNFNQLGDFLGGNAAATPKAMIEEESKGFNFWPWLIGALLLAAAFWAFRQCGSKTEETTTEVIETVEVAADSTASLVDSAASVFGDKLAQLGAFFKTKLPNGVELNIPENGIENNLIKFISDNSKAVDKTTWFNFDRILFATGSSALSPESKEQVKNIAEILKAFPNVAIKIGGYTDNTGDKKANLKLSAERATSVMNAIVAEGIEATRIEAEGYGDQHPVASNDTPEGREQNRRIAVRVTKK